MTAVDADAGQLLADAELALVDAASELEASTRRRCHAHHAATVASEVIMRPESTDTQRDQASAVLGRALAWAELPHPESAPRPRYQAVIHATTGAAVPPGTPISVDDLREAIAMAAAGALPAAALIDLEVEILRAAGRAVFITLDLTTDADPTTARRALTRACAVILDGPHYGLSAATLTTALNEREDPTDD